MSFFKKETEQFTSLWQSKSKILKYLNIVSIICLLSSFVFGYLYFISSYSTLIHRIVKVLMLYGFVAFFIGFVDNILYTIYI